MPELPEVQTIVSDLNKVLPGLKIRDVWRGSRKLIKSPKNFNEFKNNLLGKKILKIRRTGKNILIDLSGGFILLLHQKMTGHLLYGTWNLEFGIWKSKEKGLLQSDPHNQYIHFVLNLSNGKQLALSDLRKFAKIMLVKTKELENLKEIKELGPDPLEKKFNFKKFKEIIAAKSGKIKQILMDQKNIAGIGNIYADEILWEAGVYSARAAKSLNEEELKKTYKAVKKILPLAIKAHGDSMSDYRRPSGKKGNYQNMQKAYRMTGKKCAKKDGGIIKRIKIAGRSAHFCPVHQK